MAYFLFKWKTISLFLKFWLHVFEYVFPFVYLYYNFIKTIPIIRFVKNTKKKKNPIKSCLSPKKIQKCFFFFSPLLKNICIPSLFIDLEPKNELKIIFFSPSIATAGTYDESNRSLSPKMSLVYHASTIFC